MFGRILTKIVGQRTVLNPLLILYAVAGAVAVALDGGLWLLSIYFLCFICSIVTYFWILINHPALLQPESVQLKGMDIEQKGQETELRTLPTAEPDISDEQD